MKADCIDVVQLSESNLRNYLNLPIQTGKLIFDYPDENKLAQITYGPSVILITHFYYPPTEWRRLYFHTLQDPTPPHLC